MDIQFPIKDKPNINDELRRTWNIPEDHDFDDPETSMGSKIDMLNKLGSLRFIPTYPVMPKAGEIAQNFYEDDPINHVAENAVQKLISAENETGIQEPQIEATPEASALFNLIATDRMDDDPKNKYAFSFHYSQKMITTYHLRRIDDDVYKYEQSEGNHKLLNTNGLKTLIRARASPEEQSRLSRLEVMDIVERIQTEPTIQVQQDFFDNDEFLVNFLNGTLDLRKRELLPHSPNFRLTSLIKANYISNYSLDGSMFEKNLHDITDGSEVKALHLQEIAGYNLSAFSGVKKATVLDGDRHTGKTTFNAIFNGLLGEENVSHFALKALNDRFSSGKLLTKKVNIFGERGVAVQKDCETFKALTGSEWCETENKGQNYIGRPAKTKLIFAGNKLPLFENPEDNAAFMDRITLFIFGHYFSEEVRIRDMDKRLLEERDLIASWAMDGLFRLIENNFVFHEADDAKAMRKSRMSQVNVIKDFISEHCEIKPKARVFSRDLYERYRQFCSRNAVNCLDQAGLISELIATTERLGPVHKKVRIGKGGPYYGFDGLGLKDDNPYDTNGTAEQKSRKSSNFNGLDVFRGS